MKCKCGCERFMAHQICRHDVAVDGRGDFLSDQGIYDSETPFGPFTCTNCGIQYDELLPDEEDRRRDRAIAGHMVKQMFRGME